MRNACLHFIFILIAQNESKRHKGFQKYGLVSTSPEKSIKKCIWYPNTFKNKNVNN